jgi:diguanylate cyclase (GGDEF)-like protein/PAS domain S-box-containing protein
VRHRSFGIAASAVGLLLVDLALPPRLRALSLLAFAAFHATTTIRAVRRHRPLSPWPFHLVSFTTCTATVGIALQVAAGRTQLDMPLASHLLILVGLVAWAAAMALLVRCRSRMLDRYQLLDLGIFLVSATVTIKQLVLEPSLQANPPAGMSPQLSLVYILIQFICLVLLVRFATLPGRRPIALWLMMASLVASTLGSVLSHVLPPDVATHLSLFAAGTLSLLACAHPSMRSLTAPATGESPKFGILRSAALGIALVLGPITAAVDHGRTDEFDVLWFLGPTMVVTTLVLVRLRLLFAREQQAQEDLAASHATFRALVHGISDVILVLRQDATIAYASASSATTIGRASDLLLDRGIDAVVAPVHVDLARQTLGAVWASGGAATVQVEVPVGSRPRTFELALTDHVGDPNVRGVVAVLHDVTERNQLESQLRHQAMHDALTGLPNRVLLADELAERATSGVLFVDLDDFKAVNDGLGHEVGDRLLQAVAHRLRATVREGDVVARLGGDEFAVVVDGDRAADVGRRLLEALVEPFELSGHRITVGASIGVTVVGDTPDALLRNADMAMYTAKAGGKGALAVFEPGMQERASERLLVQLELADALQQGQLRLLYQPVFDLSTGRLAGGEALIRWPHPTRGLLGPDRFIGIAEETGSIVAIGRWVLGEACRVAASWPEDVDVAVNLSARQLESATIVDDVVLALTAASLRPERLVLEITESMLAKDLDAIASRLGSLKALGVRIAIDDFGTGYSSLSTLSRFPVDVLKIDRSFVATMVDNPEAAALVQVLVEMGRALHLSVVAEGIEDADQADALRAQLCDLGQGFYFSRPVAGEDFARLLATRAVEPSASPVG